MKPGVEEIELRLATSASAAARLWKCAALSSFVPLGRGSDRLLSIYWDTPDLRLHQLGLALRVRRRGSGGWTQTLKTPATRIDTRGEYEAPLAGMQPELQVARRCGWQGDAAVLAMQDELRPVFRTRIVRTSIEVRFDDGTAAELALDRGVIALESRQPAVREPVLEIEIELVTGRADRLYELAYRLVAELPSTRLLTVAKSERGYRLLTGLPPTPRHARDIEVPRNATAAAIATRGFTESLAHVRRNVEPARQATDSEAVHQMRVGVRRLRVAARVTQKAGLPSMSDKLVDELRWLWKILGASRDADVFVAESWPQIQRAASAPSTTLGQFTANLARLRATSRRDVRRALDSRRFQLIMLSLSWIATLQHDAARSGPPRPGARHFAKGMLSRRAKRLTHVDTDHLTDTRRHRLRIDGKKLRYLAEFMAGLYAVRTTRRYLRRLAALQTVLGDMNDAVATQRCIGLATATLPARQRAIVLELCRQYVKNRAPLLARDFDRAWRKFVKARAFWA